jgi:hexosaminidase
MKRFFLFLSCLLISHYTFSQNALSESAAPAEAAVAINNTPPEIAIIPEPVSVVKSEGHFILPANVTIQCVAAPETQQLLAFLQEKLSVATGSYVSIVSTASAPANIKLLLNEKANQLTVTPNHVTIKANKPAGLSYGVQSLLQLFPAAIESKEKVEDIEWKAPCVEVTDYPRLGWRGLMFDVARHFFTKQEVKQYIDAMVRYKYNVLHLHLTDDEGWRIEIKGLPKLTEVGAWSVKKVGEFGNFIPPAPDEPRNYGGFYTQEDIKELVKYAKDRFVNILPEIDVPGHSLAAIVSYPELSCTPGVENYRVRSGERIMDWSRGAPPTALVDNTLCPANEKVYTFLDTIITQVAALFPFEYIHMGGDEAPFNFWEKNEAIKALMQKEGLKDMHQVQGYFEKRVQKIVESKGKKFMGWDEILNGDIPSSAAVMSWRGMKYGIEASKNKHELVMSPTDYAYLDYMQADPITEPKVYASLRLSKTYEFDPLPASADPKYIKGGQANLWTEQIYNIRQAEYMTWPRGMAIAESKYAPSVYDPIFKVSRSADGQLLVELGTEIEGLDIYYSFDNSFPDRFYPKYTEKITPPKDATMLKVITYRDKMPVGRMLNMPVEELNKRAGRK